MNEIWGAFYPGMTEKAAERSGWAARVMTDEWATHPDIAYGVMYSAAFFENDVHKLVQLAAEALPRDSPYRRGIEELIDWRSEYEDWRDTRALLHQKYYLEVAGFEVPYPVASSVINGLCGVMAILCGDGDYMKTVGIATAAGYDCDNQAATCGGLLGIINGASSIPDALTLELPSRGRWDQPFNNTYINYSRDELPNHHRISDIIERILAVAEQAILANGGTKSTEDGTTLYKVNSDLP